MGECKYEETRRVTVSHTASTVSSFELPMLPELAGGPESLLSINILIENEAIRAPDALGARWRP